MFNEKPPEDPFSVFVGGMDEVGLLTEPKLILSSPKPAPEVVVGGAGVSGRCMLLFTNILSNPTILAPVAGTLVAGRCVGERFEFSSEKNISKLKDDAGRGGGLNLVGLFVAWDCLTVGRGVGGGFEFSSGKKKSKVNDDEPFDDFLLVGGTVWLRIIFTEGS